MTQKSFSSGSEYPALAKGKLRLYSMRFCPFAQRTRLVLAYKNIPHETVNVDLKQKPEWFLERNPLGLVPVLEQDSKVVYESLVTCDYLDDVYPQNPLTPADPYRKARDAMIVDFYGSKFIPSFYKVMRSYGKDEEAKEAMTKAMNKLEGELATRGKFFGGERLAMADMMMWPWFERMGVLKEACPDVVPSESVFPKLFSWMQSMVNEPSVKATYFDLSTHLRFFKSYAEGSPDYDFGLEP